MPVGKKGLAAKKGSAAKRGGARKPAGAARASTRSMISKGKAGDGAPPTVVVMGAPGPSCGPTPSMLGIAQMEEPGLRAACVAVGAETGGTRADLVGRLCAHYGLGPGAAPASLAVAPSGASASSQAPAAGLPLTLELLFDNGHIDDAMLRLARDCDVPEDCVDVLVAIAVFMSNNERFDVKVPGEVMITPGRLTRLTISVVPGEGGMQLGSYAGAGFGRHAVVEVFYALRDRAVIVGASRPPVKNQLVFENALADLVDRSLAAAVPAALIPSYLAVAPARAGSTAPARGREDGEEDKRQESRYMHDLKDARMDKHVPEHRVVSVRNYAALAKGLKKPDGTYFIPTDPQCQLQLMKPMYDSKTGGKIMEGPVGDGVTFTTGSDGTQKAEMTQAAVQKMYEHFGRESMADTKRKARLLVTVMYVICYEYEGRFKRQTLERYESMVERLSDTPGMNGHKFRQILLQGEAIRIKFTNESDGNGKTAGGAVASIDAGYLMAIERLEECLMDHVVGQSPNDGNGNGRGNGTGGGGGGGGGGAPSPSDKNSRNKRRGQKPNRGKVWAKLPGGMGATHLGGKQCTNDAHDPTKGGNKMALCAFSHIHWDAALQPTTEQIATAVAIAEAASK